VSLQRRYNRQKLVTKLETNSLEKYIEDKVRKQAYLEQKIAEKRLILEGKREQEAKEEKLLRRKRTGLQNYFPEEDFMVQTDCIGCGNFRLLRIDRPICSICERSYELVNQTDQPTGENHR
jgi:hypothetical protein